MDDKARLGKRFLVFMIVLVALIEITTDGLSIAAGRFDDADVIRGILTTLLWWRVWSGSAWARWLLAGLFLAAALFVVIVVASFPAVKKPPEVMGLMLCVGAICATLGAGMASPWVGAYQAARRRGSAAEPDVAHGQQGS